jgi:hypothetical protein
VGRRSPGSRDRIASDDPGAERMTELGAVLLDLAAR